MSRSATLKSSFFENLALDVKFATTKYFAQPMTTFFILVTLALSLGATTSIFSVVNGLMFQATPFKDSEKLVILQQQNITNDQIFGFSASELVDYQEQASTFDDIAEYHNMTFTMYGNGDPIRVRTGIVSSNFFDMLNLKPVLGRTFTEEEDDLGAEPLLLLTHEFWQREFAGRENVVNQTVEFNNRSHRIIGVLPHFPQFPDVNDVYMTIPSCPWRSSENGISNRQMRMMSSFAKIKSGFTLEDVNNEVASIASGLGNTYPEAYGDNAKVSGQALSLHEELVRSSRPYLYTLLTTTVLLFLIAIANVTNLTLSQHAKRKREFAVRASLGASKSRIMQQLLTESLILSLIGGGLGVALSVLGLEYLKSLVANFSSLASEITIDTNVLIFAFVISILAGVVSGLVPSFTKTNLVTSLKEGGKSSFSTDHGILRNALLVGQFALSLTLLIAAGLTIKSLNNLKAVDMGYSTDNVAISKVDLNWTVYSNGEERWQISQQILQEVRQLPYVTSSALSMTYPNDTVAANFRRIRNAIQLDDRDFNQDDVLPDAYSRPVTDGYFDTLGSEILFGRDFTSDDDAQGAQVAIINNKLAQHLWPNENAVNHRISLNRGENWFTIVGVVDDIREHGADSSTSFQIYFPMAQSPSGHVSVLAKYSSENLSKFHQDFKAIVKQLDNRQPISKNESLEQASQNSIALQTFLAKLLSGFSLLALIITISGVSGVMSYMVNIRTREIGIRMAIGANKLNVVSLILLYGIKLTALGLVIGLTSGYFSGSFLSEHLFDIQAFDIAIYSATFIGLLAISIMASFLPAYRASSIPPMKALKSS